MPPRLPTSDRPPGAPLDRSPTIAVPNLSHADVQPTATVLSLRSRSPQRRRTGGRTRARVRCRAAAAGAVGL